MDKIITEKKYPIQNIWLLKQTIAAVVILVIFILIISAFNLDNYGSIFSLKSLSVFLPFLAVVIIALIIPVIVNVLRRTYFRWSIEENFIVIHQGIIYKENRNIPYGVIQGIFVNQKLSDKIFDLASLTFEDFSHGGASMMDASGYAGSGKSKREVIGFLGNKVHIPGLKKKDAEELRDVILQKMKENPIDDSQSGL